jgi:hypothetical protein
MIEPEGEINITRDLGRARQENKVKESRNSFTGIVDLILCVF